MNKSQPSKKGRNFKLRTASMMPTEKNIDYPPKGLRDLTPAIETALNAGFVEFKLVDNTPELEASRKTAKGKGSVKTTRKVSDVREEM